MPSSQANGTQTTVISTEHTLTTITTAGTYVLAVDLNEMAAGDVIEVRAYLKVLTGSTEAVLYFDVWADEQPTDDVVKFLVPIPTVYSCKFTLTHTAGTALDVQWEAINIA